MATTSTSLLERLRRDPHSPEWTRLVDIYSPLVRGWLRRQEVLGSDCDDLVQEVLTVVVRRLPEFEHNERTGAFRSWLRTITANCLRDFWRSRKNRPHATGDSEFQQFLGQLEDPASALTQAWNREHDLHVTRRLLEDLRGGFEDRTWLAFQRVALEGAKVPDVARELGISTNAVSIAKSRVLSRLRQEAAGLLEDDAI